MNINELEELAKEWNSWDECNDYAPAVLELIAAYREAVAALYTLTQCAPAEVECNNMHHKITRSA